MGFASQPPLSSLGTQGGFVPGAPPTSLPHGWREEKVAHAPATAAASPQGFVPPAVTAPMHAPFQPQVGQNVAIFSPAPATTLSESILSPAVPNADQTRPHGQYSTTVHASGSSVIAAHAGVSGASSSNASSTATSLRGKERYCSGGAWVGPAPGWPKPPPTATIENSDTSQARERDRSTVNTLRDMYHQALQNAPASRLKELEGISTKIGGLFVFLNNTGVAGTESDDTITEPVADALMALTNSIKTKNSSGVNSTLLYLSQNHWEEVSYWFMALKRLVKLVPS